MSASTSGSSVVPVGSGRSRDSWST
jgi:hypothetical protein